MWPRRLSTAALAASALALAACGSGKQVNPATYTCAQFKKSLRTNGDNTSGNFINKLRKQANLGQPKQIEVREISFGVYFACRGKPGSTRPAAKAIATAKAVKAGTYKPAPGPAKKKKSTK